MPHTVIGHAHLKVRDLARAIAFYEKFLGLRLVERVADQYAFMTSGALHHELALNAQGAAAPPPAPHAVGLFHVAFEVADKRAFAQAYQQLRAAGVPVGPVDHRISWAMYFDDPDGNGLEIYCDTRAERGVQLWQGINEPLDDATILRHL